MKLLYTSRRALSCSAIIDPRNAPRVFPWSASTTAPNPRMPALPAQAFAHSVTALLIRESRRGLGVLLSETEPVVAAAAGDAAIAAPMGIRTRSHAMLPAVRTVRMRDGSFMPAPYDVECEGRRSDSSLDKRCFQSVRALV